MQLLVISGSYSVPQLLTERVGRKEYRDVYLDLNGASIADTKVFIEDPGADGIKAKREDNQAFDQCEIAGKRTMFNGDWKTQKMSEQDYMKALLGRRRPLFADPGGAAGAGEEILASNARRGPHAVHARKKPGPVQQ